MPDPCYFDMVRTPRGGWGNLTCKDWLLWPALCYRVTAPEAQQQDRNLFERSVLGLANARVIDHEAQAELLGLDGRLVATIRSQLMDEGFLESSGALSAQGLDELHGSINETTRFITGYVFQDPFTGSLWDRFVEDPQYAHVELDGNTRYIIRGATGRPFRTRAFAQDHPQDIPAQPTHAEVCNAIRRFQRTLDRSHPASWDSPAHNSEMLDLDEDLSNIDDSVIDNGLSARVTRVSFLDSKPIPCFLATVLYSRSPIPLPSTLLAADPFLRGASDRLLQQILDQADAHRDAPLAKMLNSVFQRTHQATLPEFREQFQSFRLQAEMRVEEQLGFDRRDLPVFSPLARMERAFLEAEVLDDCCEDKQLEALANARTAFETLFKGIAHDSRLSGIERHLDLPHFDRTPEKLQGRFEDIATGLGLSVPLPPNLTIRNAHGRVRRLVHDPAALNRAQFRDLFVVCLLAAIGDSRHPFALAAHRDGDFANRVFRLADNLNAAAHGELPTNIRSSDLRSELYALFALLLDDLSSTEGAE